METGMGMEMEMVFPQHGSYQLERNSLPKSLCQHNCSIRHCGHEGIDSSCPTSNDLSRIREIEMVMGWRW